MELATIIIRFIGAWLLFAGSIFQAVLELQDVDLEADRIRASFKQVEKTARPSSWWLLLPPVWIVKQHRRNRSYHNQALQALSAEDNAAMNSFRSKAFAWQIVAVGGLCIAIGETYEFTNHEAWNVGALVGLTAAMFLLSVSNTLYSVRRARTDSKAS